MRPMPAIGKLESRKLHKYHVDKKLCSQHAGAGYTD